jgi:peptidyl-prolyl cis-trans isomerase A (cyclophilin A)
MLDPKKANARAPAQFGVRVTTSQGVFELACKREWAPKAADRFYNLVRIGFYDDTALFRVITSPKPFVVQWGIHGDPKVNVKWNAMTSEPDPVQHSNTRGTLTFAMGGSPKTFSTQVFINLGDNPNLDAMGFAPVCSVVGEGMAVVDRFFADYAGKPSNQQDRIQAEGNGFLRRDFPNLDYIESARLRP